MPGPPVLGAGETLARPILAEGGLLVRLGGRDAAHLPDGGSQPAR